MQGSEGGEERQGIRFMGSPSKGPEDRLERLALQVANSISIPDIKNGVQSNQAWPGVSCSPRCRGWKDMMCSRKGVAW